MAQALPKQPGSPAERRRSRRFHFISPVEATWQEAGGTTCHETTRATEVSAHGGLLEMNGQAVVGSQIELKNLISREVSSVRVVGIRRDSEGAMLGVAVELQVPSETFWGTNFQLKKACAELVKLEFDLRTGEIDGHILKEFRDAVDHVRKTAWAVQEWQHRQSEQDDSRRVLSLLTAERIRRATELCEMIAAALTDREIQLGTVGIEKFVRALERVQGKLADLYRESKA